MPKTETLSRVVVFEECFTCGAPIAMSEGQQRQFHETGMTIRCVLGHGTVRRQSDLSIARAKLQEAQDRLARAETSLRNEQKAHGATRRAKQRLQDRVRNGVCPHCHRSFQNLKRHIASKHGGD